MSDPGPKLMRGLIEVFILESLEESPKHGYALLKEMEDRFGQEPNRNKIYPLLQKLEDDGLLEALPDENDPRGKTLYRLTAAGREELDAYRKLPRAFRDAVHRLWPGVAPEPASAPAPAPPRQVTVTQTSRAPPAAAAAEPAATVIAKPRPARGEVPYPCADARVSLVKDPRTGDLAVTLSGCPMGAYDYCPECPVYHAVAGLRKLTLG